jgi:hypothetical protein
MRLRGVVAEVRALNLVTVVDEHLGDARHAYADEVDRADLARQFPVSDLSRVAGGRPRLMSRRE